MSAREHFLRCVQRALIQRGVVYKGIDRKPGDPVTARYDEAADRWYAECNGVHYERPGDLSGAWVEVKG